MNFKQKLFNLFFAIVSFGLCTIPTSITSYAIAEIGLGSETAQLLNGDLYFSVKGYLVYNKNTSTQLDVESLAISGVNYGTYTLDEFFFEVSEGNFNKTVSSYGKMSFPTGSKYRVEKDWWTQCKANGYNDAIFNKNGSENNVYTDVSAGNSGIGLASFETFWYANSRKTYFHQ